MMVMIGWDIRGMREKAETKKRARKITNLISNITAREKKGKGAKEKGKGRTEKRIERIHSHSRISVYRISPTTIDASFDKQHAVT